MKYTAVIVTGDRNALRKDWEFAVQYALRSLSPSYKVLIHGDCRGIDHIARDIALALGWHIVPMPFMRGVGNGGGPLRNLEMGNVGTSLQRVGYDVQVFAFHADLDASKGTKDMVRVGLNARFPVTLFDRQGTAQRVTVFP